eukprot:CAMPEP_0185541228 /NCGR_PEP_ID=MMETSP1381-20130426/1826_1 /TAXON_ID=298111 /ORGANISM="Pavlova sp., Strain CCMP459" /LENGTH=169 /DNA_ID=CAMNT_0028153131 /DNA_START=41 /DNA_END=550 /DNA_ORIENTATION=-
MSSRRADSDIFGAAQAQAPRAPSSHRPADSDIFSSKQAAPAPSSSQVKTTFPGTGGAVHQAGPRGDHGRSIHDSSLDLGGGYGDQAKNHVRPTTAARRLNQEQNKPAGSARPEVIINQQKSNDIFGTKQSSAVLREANASSVVPSFAGMKGVERRNAIAAWRNGKSAES